MKALFVGDVHNHLYMLNKVEELDNKYKFDRIIFTGDYVDDWKTDNHDSLETLNKIIELKRSNFNKYTFCLGNHELSYLGYPCSGHRFELDDIMQITLKENIDCFDLFASIELNDKKFICTHAGLSNKYIDDVLNGYDNYEKELLQLNNDILNNLYLLTMCSYLRGGNCEFSSFLWADRKEHLYYNQNKKPYLQYQIIGHTPVLNIDINNDFIFIDTHSTYRDGSKYGDQSYLLWLDNHFEIIK